MKTKLKIVGALWTVIALVGVSAMPAFADSRDASLSCGGQAYPTVQYQNPTSYTETLWKNASGTPIKDTQYAPNAAVYNQSPIHTTSIYHVVFETGTSFSYFNSFCG